MLVRYIKEQNSKVDYKQYLEICEQLGRDPDPEKMPLELSVFPGEIQVAFFVFSLLSDRWEGMTGSYLGKDYSDFELICDLWSLDSRRELFLAVKRYDMHLINFRYEQQEKQRKTEEKKRKAARGNEVTHVTNHG